MKCATWQCNCSKFNQLLFCFTGIGAALLAGWFGRRILMLISCLGVAVSLTAVGLYFFLQDSIKISPESLSLISALPLVGILGFNVLYAVGIGILPYVMQAELFPINVKTVASSSATMLACVLSFAVAKCYQSVKDSFGHHTVFWSFATVAYLGVVFVYFLVPETKGKTLEEVQDKMQERKEVPDTMQEWEELQDMMQERKEVQDKMHERKEVQDKMKEREEEQALREKVVNDLE